ncbi:LOW QUALITY PROTEIN: uncharacterized protein ACJ7VT_007705 [Polymixia lowei]
MAEAISKEADMFCSICLDLLRNPVSINCGHNYCMDCINGYWDQDSQRMGVNCPQCRQTFIPRPVLKKNTVLAEAVEKLMSGAKRDPSVFVQSEAGPGDVQCDFCTVRKLKAVKTCLVCLASYCTTHLQPHYESSAFKRHKLVEISTPIEEKICPRHDKLLEVYCRTDDQCICLLCDSSSESITTSPTCRFLDEEPWSRKPVRSEKFVHCSSTRCSVRWILIRGDIVPLLGFCAMADLLDAVRDEECVMGEHKGHDTVSAASERTEKQNQFGVQKRRYQKNIQERERELRELKHTMKTLKIFAGSAIDESEKTVTEVILSIEKRHSSMKELIRSQEKVALSRAEVLANRLEEEIAELKKKDTELKQLSLTEDHIHFLQSCRSVFDCSDSDTLSDAGVHQRTFLKSVMKVISDVKDRLESMAKAIAEISDNIQLDIDPKTRQEFVIYTCQLTLDPNTAFQNLLLSEGNRKVTWCKKAQNYPEHPERFTEYDQVLCSEGLSGVCYWEAEWKGPRVEVVVSYKGTELKESGFGYSDQSWCMSLSHSGCTFWHNGIKTKMSAPCASRIGVYLYHEAGILSFYNVSDSEKMTLLHRVYATFSQPLYPGFMVVRGSSVRIIQPEMAVNLECLDCSICLHLLTEPVTTACGHSYCMDCINTFWDKDKQNGIYSCPQCRQTFTPRPALKKNTLLAELLEKHKKENDKDTSSGGCWAAAGDVECDACVGRKQKAVKFCLVCLASYCDTHLTPHFEVPPLRKHKLVQASKKIKESICRRHEKLLEVYCRTDHQCICMLCAMDEHKGHDTVSIAAERDKKQSQLEKTKEEFRLTRIETERKMKELRQATDSIHAAAWETVSDFEELCREHICSYIRSVELKCSEMREKVGETEKTAVDCASGLLGKLKLEVSELRRRDAELDEMSLIEDPIQFLKTSLCFTDPPVSQTEGLETTTLKTVSAQKVKIEKMCAEEKGKILRILEKNMLLNVPKLQEKTTSRSYLLVKFKNRRLEVDPNTVAACLSLSESNTEISWSDRNQTHPDHPDRFTYYYQALCKEGLTCDCYWEVEWDGGIVEVAVSYKGIQRKGSGNDCCFGHNNLSWSLICSPSGCTFWHNKIHKSNIPAPPCRRVGVYLDYYVGLLSFYSVSDAGAFTRLHQIQTMFTEPVYPGFCVDSGSTVKICKL